VAAGDLAGAADSSKKAKMFSYIFLGLGIVVWACYLIFFGGLAALSVLSSH